MYESTVVRSTSNTICAISPRAGNMTSMRQGTVPSRCSNPGIEVSIVRGRLSLKGVDTVTYVCMQTLIQLFSRRQKAQPCKGKHNKTDNEAKAQK